MQPPCRLKPSNIELQILNATHHCFRFLCRYSELLKEIRLGNVKKVAFFDNDDIMEDRKEFQPVEGPCLVIFHDDRVAHSYVPRYDYRIPCGSTTPHISKQSALPYLTICLDSPQHAMHMLLCMRPQINLVQGPVTTQGDFSTVCMPDYYTIHSLPCRTTSSRQSSIQSTAYGQKVRKVF